MRTYVRIRAIVFEYFILDRIFFSDKFVTAIWREREAKFWEQLVESTYNIIYVDTRKTLGYIGGKEGL